MPEDYEASLGDQPTFDGPVEQNASPQSLGDEVTFSGIDDDENAPFDDGMEVVDLSARYTVDGTLGKGGMGEVLLATDTRLERKVAIKRMLGDAVNSRTAVSRFLTEAKSIAALNHPNIVQIYDYGRASDGPFLIMEFVEGSSLLDKCREGAIPLHEAIELTCQLCDGLGKAHDANIIHRDIKPANILLTNDGVPKLTDFGLAKDETADSALSVAGAVLGTLDFMSPEQRRDSALTDSRSDLWSLAATLYQMVSGRSPKIIRFSNIPQALQEVLEKALEDSKDDRYQTAREFRDALRASLTTNEPVPEVAVDLGAGECPKCHAKNEADRKFCRGCGESLRVSCLSCSGDVPVWENFCAECGGNQVELIASKLEAFAKQLDQAEKQRREYRFEDALQIARSLTSVEDERLAEHVPWAEEFVTATEAAWERERESASAHFAEARTHRDAFDYASAIHAVESVPEAMRTSKMSRYLQRLESDHAESEELIRTISERVQRRDLYGLLEKVDRAVGLRGDRADLQKLQTQLRERKGKRQQQRDEAIAEAKRLRDKACAEATRLFRIGDAKGALTMIQSVPSEDLRSSDEQLRSQLEDIVAAEDELTALVKESKADGVLDPDEVVSMWKATVSYLKLNPCHEKIAGMQQQLEARIQKAPAKYAAFGELAGFWPKQPAAVLSKLPTDVLPSINRDLPLSSNSIGMKFKPIIGGTFTMGEGVTRTRPATLLDAEYGQVMGNEAHQVTLTEPFELGIYAVTQDQYEQVMGSNLSKFKGPQNPVESVSWDDAVEFCRKLSALPAEKSAGYVYRLPTEAEWEYACRAGTKTKYSFGDSESELGDYAWYEENSGGTTHPVGGKKPNPWGLYDMHGNVYEWCQDWYGHYPGGKLTDPTGAASGSFRVSRGGCAWHFCDFHRSANRTSTPDPKFSLLGFRVLRSSIK